MSIVPIQLGIRSNSGKFGLDGNARLINCYAEELGDEGKIPFPIYGIDGWTNFATLTGEGGVRALIVVDDYLYAVAGRILSRVDTSGTVSYIGGVASDGLVTMARNRRSVPQIAIVCNGLAYIVAGGIQTQISDTDLPPPISVTQLDGYFIFLLPDGRMFASAIDDGTSIDGLDFVTAEANPDGGVRNFARGRDLVTFGQRSTEFHQNEGLENFPFGRTTSIDVGCLAAGSVASVLIKRGSVSDAIGFVGTNSDGAYAGVMLLQGYTPQKISTPQCDRDILAEADPSAIVGYSWDEGSHSFYAVSGSDFTWVYDASTGLPHERKSYGLNRYRPNCAASFSGSTVFGDYAAAKIYRRSTSALDEAGQPIVLDIWTPPVHAFPHRMMFNAAYVDVVPGVGRTPTLVSRGS
jgi:hypothetical protein